MLKLKRWSMMWVVGLLMSGFAGAQGDDARPMFGVQATLGPAWGVADKTIRDSAQVGPSVGGSIMVNPHRKLGLFFAFDRLDLTRQFPAEAETFTGGFIVRGPSMAEWVPYVQAGAGVGRVNEFATSSNVPAVKAGIGIERFFTRNVSLALAANYNYIRTDPDIFAHETHAIVAPALVTSYYFGPSAPLQGKWW